MKNRYYMASGDLGIDYRDIGPWRSYYVDGCNTNSLGEALGDLTISEVDQDGGDLDCYGFWDAPSEVQDRVLRLLGVSMDEAIRASMEVEGERVV